MHFLVSKLLNSWLGRNSQFLVVVCTGGSGDSLVFLPAKDCHLSTCTSKNLSLLRNDPVSSICLVRGKLGPLPAAVLSALSTAGASSASQHERGRVDLSNTYSSCIPGLEGVITPYSPACSSPALPKKNSVRLNPKAHSHHYQSISQPSDFPISEFLLCLSY